MSTALDKHAVAVINALLTKQTAYANPNQYNAFIAAAETLVCNIEAIGRITETRLTVLDKLSCYLRHGCNTLVGDSSEPYHHVHQLYRRLVACYYYASKCIGFYHRNTLCYHCSSNECYC
jgi:hypothetical protein